VEPTSLALPVLINGVRALASAYDGYEKGKFMKSDQAVRQEISRRTEMMRGHLERIQTRAHRDGDRALRNECEQILITLQGVSDDAQMAVTGSPTSIHDGAGKLSRKGQKKIVEHDLKTLNILVDCTRLVNAILSPGEVDIEGDISINMVHDKIARARNHFLERNMYIDGLVKR
jgi:hypothetical protein